VPRGDSLSDGRSCDGEVSYDLADAAGRAASEVAVDVGVDGGNRVRARRKRTGSQRSCGQAADLLGCAEEQRAVHELNGAGWGGRADPCPGAVGHRRGKGNRLPENRWVQRGSYGRGGRRRVDCLAQSPRTPTEISVGVRVHRFDGVWRAADAEGCC